MQRILLLESGLAHSEAIQEILAAADYSVTAATDGWAGLQLTRQAPPDLVLCAAWLPGLDGYGLLHLYKQAPGLRTIPFVITGTDASYPALRRAMEHGADDYLALPCEASALLRTVAIRLGRADTGVALVPDEPRSLAALAAAYPPRLIARRQAIYTEGEDARYLYYVQTGRVKTTKMTSFGKELITGIYHPHEFFGCKDLLERSAHHETALAIEETMVHFIPAADFWQQLRWPDISLELLRQLAGRKRLREDMLLDMAYHSLRRRLANALLLLHEQAENRINKHNEPIYIQLAREDIAALVGITTESVSRTLSEFRQDQLLELTPKGIRLLQPGYLRLAEW